MRVREGKTIEDLTSTQIWQSSKSTISKNKKWNKGQAKIIFFFSFSQQGKKFWEDFKIFLNLTNQIYKNQN